MKRYPNRPAKRQILVVGNGMVSHRFVSEIIRRDTQTEIALTVFGEESYPAYDRVHLSDYFKQQDSDRLLLGSAAWYERNGVTLLAGTRIVAVDTEAKRIVSADGRSFAYDQLVLACGSSPFVPPVAGADCEGVFVYRTIEDARRIISFAAGKKNAVVLGGGLLGLEAANALRELGLTTSVVEFANGLMPRQLNQEGSRILENELMRLGVTALLKKGAKTIQKINTSLLITFSDETQLETDLLVIATGVRPRDELAKQAGLSLGARGGIAIDDSLQTSDNSIFAIGECAMHRGQIYGLVAPGYQMADVLAERFTGGSSIFEGAELSCRLKLLGVEVSVFGDNLGEGKSLTYTNAKAYRMLVLKRDRLVGGTVVGEWDQTHQLQLAVSENRFFAPVDQALFQSEGRINSPSTIFEWPANATICNCRQISKGAISDCISGGAASVDVLIRMTGAGSVCGSCRPLLARLVGATGEEAAVRPRGRRLLGGASAAAILAVAALAYWGPLPPSASVQTLYFRVSTFWNDDLSKQISGYTIAALSLLAVGLSARRRIRALRFGDYGTWRALHALLGSSCLLVLWLHTGMDFGENLNLWLMSCFVALNLAGALVGFSVAMEDRFSSPAARFARSVVTKMHLLFLWPYPVLLGFHIYKAYVY